MILTYIIMYLNIGMILYLFIEKIYKFLDLNYKTDKGFIPIFLYLLVYPLFYVLIIYMFLSSVKYLKKDLYITIDELKSCKIKYVHIKLNDNLMKTYKKIYKNFYLELTKEYELIVPNLVKVIDLENQIKSNNFINKFNL